MHTAWLWLMLVIVGINYEVLALACYHCFLGDEVFAHRRWYVVVFLLGQVWPAVLTALWVWKRWLRTFAYALLDA